MIPAFNAARTIAETLASAQRQTLSPAEILVVDDGSIDRTPAIVAEHVRRDSRVRLITTANRGVAAARNLGLAEARAEFVAFLDADDLWHAGKLDAQVDVFCAKPHLGLVYTNWRRIDVQGVVRETPQAWRLEGSVFLRHAAHNFIGNGSALMVRRAAALAVGGFDPSQRAAEDLLFQLKMAHAYEFGVAPGYYVGYRATPGSLSADPVFMLQAQMGAMDWMLAHVAPADVDPLSTSRALFQLRLALLQGSRGAFLKASAELLACLRTASPAARHDLARYVASRLRRRIRQSRPDPSVGLRFADLDPLAFAVTQRSAYTERRVARLAKRDQDRILCDRIGRSTAACL